MFFLVTHPIVPEIVRTRQRTSHASDSQILTFCAGIALSLLTASQKPLFTAVTQIFPQYTFSGKRRLNLCGFLNQFREHSGNEKGPFRSRTFHILLKNTVKIQVICQMFTCWIKIDLHCLISVFAQKLFDFALQFYTTNYNCHYLKYQAPHFQIQALLCH